MDWNVRLPTDSVERRRLQNRLAQRKFREKKRRADSARTDPPGASEQLASNHDSIAGVFSDNVTITQSQVPSYNTGSDVDWIDVDAIDRMLSSTEHHLSLPASDSSLWQLPFTTPSTGVTDRASVPSLSGATRSSAERNKAPSRSSDAQVLAPALDLHPSLNNLEPPPQDTVLELITSAQSDKGWISTLHIAAQKGHERIVRVLLRANMDPNQTDSDGRTPLTHATIEDHEPIVRLLLSHGARIAVSDREGRSALHWAVLHRRLGVLQLLLEHWAKSERDLDINVYDEAGWTPLHMAVDRAFEPGVLLLIQHGADMDAKAQKCRYTGKVVPFMDGR
ncbi:hypothetical protein NUU61_008180 [Penicillium alfredii]|uniref:BZIP domain-containing protein n=1 Tax=Penicillium alfredii TaxID=1506179 RepID=A0A9W9ERV8_9EURO|nr:uncharacterized protein NUU61_008180 [Penicillium alfredii]KAJ5086873.1 hypothetical protein NUU61_008180 [Penicillium alfredii]